MDCFSLGGMVEMKIHYRKPSLVEQMNNAIAISTGPNAKPIDYFELTSDELSANYSNFDKTIKNKIIHYSYKSIPVKVKE
jgi:hypothetical protein